MAVLALASIPAHAQEAVTQTNGPETRAQVYEAAFFAGFAPVSALDIVRRVPGFSLDLGDEEVRGFQGAAGNVVINGVRPSSKSEGLEAVLARIPARRVVRVEVGPGSMYGSDYSGRAQVLNIILSAEAGIDATVTASLRRYYDGNVVPDISGSALIKRGKSTINVAALANNFEIQEEGSDTITALPGGALIEFRRKINRIEENDPSVSASYAYEDGPSKAVRVNGRFSPERLLLTQFNRVSRPDGTERDDRLIQDFDDTFYEIGGDVTRPLSGGAIKLLGLFTRQDRDYAETVFNRRLDGTLLGGFRQTDVSVSDEAIGRLTWTRANWGGWSAEFGIEGAYNRLDSNVDLIAFAADGSETPIELGIAEAVVSERRAEAFAKAGRNIAKNLRADLGLNFEYSNLTVTGDAEAERTLKFLKPSLSLDWKPGKRWHVQFSARRTVAQLDFLDFIGAAELSTDRVDGGNENLLPQRAWELRLTVDRPILGDGLVKLELGHDRISLLQDRILTEDGFDAPGNIGTGKLFFATGTLDAPLGKFGIKGGRLKLVGTVRDTGVRDPLTSEQRAFSDFFPRWQWNATYRQDLGKIAYGFELEDYASFAFYRIEELDENQNGGVYATAFLEYRPRPRTTITLDIDNAIDTNAIRTRTFFEPNRSNPTPSSRELRERNRHVSIGLTLKQTFG